MTDGICTATNLHITHTDTYHHMGREGGEWLTLWFPWQQEGGFPLEQGPIKLVCNDPDHQVAQPSAHISLLPPSTPSLYPSMLAVPLYPSMLAIPLYPSMLAIPLYPSMLAVSPTFILESFKERTRVQMCVSFSASSLCSLLFSSMMSPYISAI